MKLFILEDDAERISWFVNEFANHNLTICNNANEAVIIVHTLKFDVIFLDHDLGGQAYVDSQEPNTGFQVAKVIPDTENKDAAVIIHSWNPDGAKNILFALKDGGQKGQIAVCPFGNFNKNIFYNESESKKTT